MACDGVNPPSGKAQHNSIRLAPPFDAAMADSTEPAQTSMMIFDDIQITFGHYDEPKVKKNKILIKMPGSHYRHISCQRAQYLIIIFEGN